MKKGDRIKTNNGYFGVVTAVHWRGASCSGFSFIDTVDITLENGLVIIGLCPKTLEIIDG